MPVAKTAYGLAGAIVESRDGELGRWTAARWSPPAASPLLGMVERIWFFDGTMTHARERVFPDGLAELVVMLDEPHRDGDAEALPVFPAVCINGLRTRPSVVVAPQGGCRVLGIRFEPAGTYRILRSSMKHLADVTIDLQDVLGCQARELGERCADAAATSIWNAARNATAILSVAVEWILRRLGRETIPDPAVHAVVQTIRRSRGIVLLDEVGSEHGVRRSPLARRFFDCVGVTPKRFARIVRFRNALSLLGRNPNIAAAAADLDYYDQAHLYRDFADFAGMTPGAFVAARRYPGSASLAET